jgi:hypothetical protein
MCGGADKQSAGEQAAERVNERANHSGVRRRRTREGEAENAQT